MFHSVDFFFNYKHLTRFVLLHKLDCFFNTYEFPRFQGFLFYFSINNLEDLDDARTFNYFFLFRFFFGNKAFFTKFSSLFSLGRTYYTFNVQSFFSGRFVFFPISFLVNDVVPFINIHNYSYYINGSFFCMSFYDMNIFLEKKNNLGLFTLKNFLNCKIFFSVHSFEFLHILLNVLKII